MRVNLAQIESLIQQPAARIDGVQDQREGLQERAAGAGAALARD